jgi:hypothetical protein
MGALKPTAELPALRFYFELLDRDGNRKVPTALFSHQDRTKDMTLSLAAFLPPLRNPISPVSWTPLISWICAKY